MPTVTIDTIIRPQQSTIILKHGQLHCKRPSFTLQNTAFYNTLNVKHLHSTSATIFFQDRKKCKKTSKIFQKTFGGLKYNAYLCTRI